MRESGFQGDLINRIKTEFPGAFVLKNDANYIQGIPDLTILFRDRWAVLECKRSATEHHQPNQDTYIEIFNGMSFARFVYPENVEEVLHELHFAFGA